MTILLNGEPVETRGAKNVSELVEAYGLPAATVLVEHNGFALHRREWIDRSLCEGDRIELVRVVAGG